MKIKAGYRLEIGSWENDADNCRTEVLDGLTEEQVRELLKLFKLFSKSHRQGGVGNMYEPSDKELDKYCEKLLDVYSSNPEFWNNYLSLSPEEVQGLAENGALFAEIVSDGLIWIVGLAGSEFFTRMLDSYKVVYTPVDITLEDVTSKF